MINAGINLATTKTQFSPTATVLAILMPSPGENAAADYLQGVKSRASEYADILSALAGLADKLIEASGAEISPAKPPEHSNLDPVGQAMQFYAQLQIVNALAKNIEDFTADVKAASHGDNTAKGKLGLDVLITVLTEAVGAYAKATRAVRLGEEIRAPQGFKSPYPEKWQRSTFSTTQGSEFIDDAIRTTEQPLSSSVTSRIKRKAAYETYSPHWVEANLNDALSQFAPGVGGIISADGVKTRFLNRNTNIEVIFDNENSYFRIYDHNKNQYINMNGRVPSTNKLSGKAAKNYIQSQTHFKNVRK
ncbi:hypothetical protein [Edaphocola flava]|uniref:hypothetical protein n=1 Tax=Edaphocola flava TaxID=2499629 RepID=UPI00100C2585|nr:hypothetical protein [Edaphocola flava]